MLNKLSVLSVLSVRSQTVSRWFKGKALPHPNTEKQLLELEFVIDNLAYFYQPHDARLRLFARQRLPPIRGTRIARTASTRCPFRTD